MRGPVCGIVGYIGSHALPFLIDGLRRLEYRGYDSAGIAVLTDGGIVLEKSEGRLGQLIGRLDGRISEGYAGVGHTRWATHGKPSDRNAHPHGDCNGDIVVVHNGIIENYRALREWLEVQGHTFTSETDTEVIPHLIEHFYAGDLAGAVRRAWRELKGSFALAVMSRSEPDRIVAVREASPLIVGVGENENFVASDIPAILLKTRKAIVLNDGEMAVLTRGNVSIMDRDGNILGETRVYEVPWDISMAEKGGYEHFMLKEIMEQPRALRETIRGRIDDRWRVVFEESQLTPEILNNLEKIFIVGCGTAYHAGLVGKRLIEKLARVPVETDLASEFRYRNPLFNPGTLVIVISQSGETADTLAAVREAKKHGVFVLAVTNVVGSSVAREADEVIYTRAGPEIAVASTKAYITQLASLTLLAIYLGWHRGTLSDEECERLLRELDRIPDKAAKTIELVQDVKDVARELSHHDDVFFIGRGLDYAVALEGQLKLKEISYIHAEAYAAGELKHGTLALIEDGVPVIALMTQPDVYEKSLSNVMEVIARGARVTAVSFSGDEEIQKYVSNVIRIADTEPLFAPILSVIPLQLLAYHAAVAKGCDVDKPRNLAKSVTVE